MSRMSNMKLNWKMGQQMLLANDGVVEYRIWWTPENNWSAERRWPGAGIGLDACLRGMCKVDFETAMAWCENGGALCQKDAEEQEKRKIDAAIAEGEKAPLKDAQLEAKFVELEQRLIGGFDALVDQTVKWQDQNVAARRPVNQELGELRARVQELEAASCVYEGSLAFHDERLEKLEAK